MHFVEDIIVVDVLLDVGHPQIRFFQFKDGKCFFPSEEIVAVLYIQQNGSIVVAEDPSAGPRVFAAQNGADISGITFSSELK